ncbi:MAG: hypothetical protein WC273_10005 [Dehalococcoidia bacterium]
MTTTNARRIGLHRAYASLSADTISIRPSRRAVVGPLVQAALAVIAVWALVTFMNVLPLWVLTVLLLFAILAGPTAMLGLVYQVAGTAFLMERAKGTCRWQQGFLGLGLGTRELVPFPRIKRIEVGGDFAEELPSGDLQDVVRWEVRLVKDNDRVLPIGLVAAARPLAGEALERANDLGRALAEMSGAPFVAGALPAWAFEDDEDDEGDQRGADGDAGGRREALDI